MAGIVLSTGGINGNINLPPGEPDPIDGNPGNFLTWGTAVLFSSIGVPATYTIGHASSAMTYDPSVSGAIISIDASFDTYFFGHHYFIEQGGEFFISANTGDLATAGWQEVTNTLTATDFSQIFIADDGSATLLPGSNPDFTATGTEIQFGIANTRTAVTTELPFIFTINEGGVDNLMYLINHVPEPSTTLIMGLGLLTIILRRQR